MQFNNSHIKGSRYGGLYPVVKEMNKRKLPELINDSFSHIKRRHNAKYSHADGFLSWVGATLTGVNRIEQITHKANDLKAVGLKVPSHDTCGRLMKSCATIPKTKGIIEKQQYRTNYYDDNIEANRMLIKATKRMGGLNSLERYTLHVDATFIKTRCRGARSSVGLDKQGFNPMVCLINKMPVYISMRNGNSNSFLMLKECVENCLDLLEESNIKVDRLISDGAGYNAELINMLDERGIKFIIRMPVNKTFERFWTGLAKSKWKKVRLKTAFDLRDARISETMYKMGKAYRAHRVVVAKRKSKERHQIIDFQKHPELMHSLAEEKERQKLVDKKLKELDNRNQLKYGQVQYPDGKWKTYKRERHSLYITNDLEKSPVKIFEEYNQRGEEERNFSWMKNDFGWKLPPFQKMEENTVFFIAAALANNIYRAAMKLFRKKLPYLEETLTRPTFQRLFIDKILIVQDGKRFFLIEDADFEKIL